DFAISAAKSASFMGPCPMVRTHKRSQFGLDRFDQLREAKAQEMWFIFKLFATWQMAKTAKSEGRKNGCTSQGHRD
ncbi:MAG: hypothetical protein AAGF82_22400, partial [Pseudomonadota bacterium]